MKFRIVTGKHIEGGTTLSAGSIVESDKDLRKVFVNKFELAEDDAEVTEVVGAEVVSGAPRQASIEAAKTARRTNEADKLLSKDLVNSRAGRSGVKTQEDLEEEERQHEEDGDEDEHDVEEGEETEKGKDVSGAFAGAKANKLTIVKDEGKGAKARYDVYDTEGEDPDSAVNTKPLKKSEVNTFVKRYAKSKA